MTQQNYISKSDLKNVRNIWAVGRNYAAHAQELGNTVPGKPLFFLKSGACIQTDDQLTWPAWALDVHHEIELAFQVNDQFQISAWGIALDLTERALQAELKKQSHPWTLAKSFIGACPISDFRKDLNWELLQKATLELSINNQIRQKAPLKQMIFMPEVLLSFVKTHFPLQPQDLILTGTPAGVGPLKSGDQLLARVFCQDEIFLSGQWTVYQPTGHK